MSLARRSCAIALTLGIVGCSAPAGNEAAPTVAVERPGGGGASFIVIESDTLIDGRRPRLTLVCEPGRRASFRLDVVRPPANAPPFRDVFAQIQVKGGPEVTIELGWMGAAAWLPRVPDSGRDYSALDQAENERRIVPILHAFGKKRALTITLPAPHGPGDRLEWSPETFAPRLAAVQDCTALDGAS